MHSLIYFNSAHTNCNVYNTTTHLKADCTSLVCYSRAEFRIGFCHFYYNVLVNMSQGTGSDGSTLK